LRPTQNVAGAGLVLRPLDEAAAEGAYFGWLHDPLVTQHLEARFTDYTIIRLRDYIRRENDKPDSVPFAIHTEPGGRFIGTIKLSKIRLDHRHCDVGLMIGEKDEWGKGRGTEAIRLACRYAFGTLGLHKVSAGCYATNPGSEHAFLRAGFCIEGRLAEDRWDGRRWVDTILLGRINPAERTTGPQIAQERS